MYTYIYFTEGGYYVYIHTLIFILMFENYFTAWKAFQNGRKKGPLLHLDTNQRCKEQEHTVMLACTETYLSLKYSSLLSMSDLIANAPFFTSNDAFLQSSITN